MCVPQQSRAFTFSPCANVGASTCIVEEGLVVHVPLCPTHTRQQRHEKLLQPACLARLVNSIPLNGRHFVWSREAREGMSIDWSGHGLDDKGRGQKLPGEISARDAGEVTRLLGIGTTFTTQARKAG